MLIAATLLTGVCGCVSDCYVVSPPDLVLGGWERIEALRPGTGIEILFPDGRTTRASYRSSTESTVDVLDESGTMRSIARQEIREIRATAADSLANGILAGMGIGAVTGGIVKAFGGGREGFWSTFGWSVVVGSVIDLNMAHHEVLYRAVP